ncbi:MAG: hypothetical protein WBA48_18790 [Xanthobacteraceae bacterium]
MASKIRIKLGSVEIEYEGDGAFLESGLVPTVEKLLQLQNEHGGDAVFHDRGGDGGSGANGGISRGQKKPSASLSTHTIATILKVSTCPDLVIAASAHLRFTLEKETFSRTEVQEQMKTAPSYYKNSFKGGNLTSAFETLTKADRLRLVANNTYSLSAKETEELEKKLAEAG